MNKLPPLPKSSLNLPPLRGKKASVPQKEEKTFSGIIDTDLIILSELEDRDLFSFCQNFESKNKYINKLCSNENFWRNRFVKKYGNAKKDPNRTWKRFYLKVTYYDDKFDDKQKIGKSISVYNDFIKHKGEILKENSDIINFFSNYLGLKVLRNILNNLDSIKKFEIYTEFKDTPINWYMGYEKYEDYMRNYPDFPGKPEISHPITLNEYLDFMSALQKHFNVQFGIDILTFKNIADKYELYSENTDQTLLLTKKQMIDIINETLKYYRVDIISTKNSDYSFDLREYLAPR